MKWGKRPKAGAKCDIVELLNLFNCREFGIENINGKSVSLQQFSSSDLSRQSGLPSHNQLMGMHCSSLTHEISCDLHNFSVGKKVYYR